MIDPADFDALARVAMSQATALLARWVGGRQQGREWVAERTRNGGIGDSWSFNLDKGIWSHFASGRKGTDLISFYAAVHNINQGPAADRIAEELHWQPGNPAPANLPRIAPVDPETCQRIPFDAPALRPHPTYGIASAVYEYGDLFRVARYDYVDAAGEAAKLFWQWTWRKGKWVAKGWPGVRPLYRLPQLLASPTAPVLVVEGEKCAEAAPQGFPNHAVVTWSGGIESISKTDWVPLHGRDVLIWPDADEPGRKAAAWLAGQLSGNAASVQVINPNGADPGWDVADALREGWDQARIEHWVAQHATGSAAPSPAPDCGPPEPVPAVITLPEPSSLSILAGLGLDCDGGNRPFPTLANASKILQSYERFKGHIWFDEFRGAIYHTLHGERPIRWTDAETRALTVAVQQQLKLPKFTSRLIEEGLHHAAECNRRNSLTEWLNQLVWDQIPRLNTWLADCAGIELNPYTLAISRNWPIAMVARAYHPGCKMDNMPVLEGMSGLRKTQFLGVLGGEWYKALSMQFGEKDFLQALRGAWLIEIPDMAGFNRAEHTKILAVITTAVDTYRVPYGREPEDVPRTCMFAATSETDDYLTDARGKRRYWPLRCQDISLEALREQRDQIFAEAILCYRAGEHWYDMPAEAVHEQAARVESDEWTEPVLVYADRWWDEYKRDPIGSAITAKRLLTMALDIPLGQITTGQCRRVTNILKANGWDRKPTNTGAIWLKRSWHDKS